MVAGNVDIADVDDLIDAFADRFRKRLRAIAREVYGQEALARRGWLDQSESDLKPRKHIEAVRRRMADGLPGAKQDGRRYLLSPEAISEELGKKHPMKKTQADGESDPVAELDKALARAAR